MDKRDDELVLVRHMEDLQYRLYIAKDYLRLREEEGRCAIMARDALSRCDRVIGALMADRAEAQTRYENLLTKLEALVPTARVSRYINTGEVSTVSKNEVNVETPTTKEG